VLEAYLQQDRFLHADKPRTVLLSEQGFHTTDYSEESFRVKAAAIAYMWEKMEPLKSIESFHYHRWEDHPLEGGLKVGVRTLPDAHHRFGFRKELPFRVLSAMETPAAEAEMETLKAVLGIRDWSEIQVPLDAIKRD
jgi:hypothetical protein